MSISFYLFPVSLTNVRSIPSCNSFWIPNKVSCEAIPFLIAFWSSPHPAVTDFIEEHACLSASFSFFSKISLALMAFRRLSVFSRDCNDCPYFKLFCSAKRARFFRTLSFCFPRAPLRLRASTTVFFRLATCAEDKSRLWSSSSSSL